MPRPQHVRDHSFSRPETDGSQASGRSCPETGRTLIDKDLSTVVPDEFGSVKLDNTVPKWLDDAMVDKSGKGHIVYLREFHLSPAKVQLDVLNLLVKKDVEGVDFPKNTMIVLGVRNEDESAEGLTHTHVVRFYK